MSKFPHINLLSKVRYYSGLISILRFLGRDYVKILLYHSVSENENCFIRGSDIWVSALTFSDHLNYIKRHYNVISLRKLVDSLKRGKIPPRSVVLTFDDGFADNFSFAYPYLKKYKIPATIFLVTDCIDKRRYIWIQELYCLINTCGAENVIEALKSLLDSSKNDRLTNRPASNTNPRQGIEKFMTYAVEKKERDEILTKLFRAFGISRKKISLENNIFLNWRQVKQMRRSGIHFGNHGESHTSLSAIPLDEQLKEIANSKKMIVDKINTDFVPFSYPFGQANDFTPATKEMIESTGHSCIVTSMPTLNNAQTSPYELGRIPIQNIPVYQLAFELEKGVLKKLIFYKKPNSIAYMR